MLKKIGKTLSLCPVFLSLLLGVGTSFARADQEVQFKAELDRDTITLDDSVSLKLTLSTGGMRGAVRPEFTAPGFIVVNEFSSTYIESFYENGHFGVRNNVTVTKVLKPQKQGNLKISNIHVSLSGKEYKAPDLSVSVLAGGSGTAPPRNYGGAGVGLRGAGKAPKGNLVFVRAEVNKNRLYKGEQVIISYYLYRRVKIFNIQVEKYPTPTGFLREDLEMPVLSGRLDTEIVVLDGVKYERSLLVRYAAYPLQSGTLKLDPMMVKYNYYNNRQSFDGDDDPFFNFFQQLNPLVGNSRSEIINLQVDELPSEGRPDHFSGGVGSFTVGAAVDKTNVKVGEAVTLLYKIEGRGNVSSIAEPKVHWPPGLESYDTKGKSKSTPRGIGEKTFEYILIPRVPGKLSLPGIAFSYFDPEKKQYLTKSSDPVLIEVSPSADGSAQGAGTATVQNSQTQTQSTQKTPLVDPLTLLHDLKPVQSDSAQSTKAISDGAQSVTLAHQPVWRWLYWTFSLILGLFLLFVGVDQWKQFKGRGSVERRLNQDSISKRFLEIKKLSKNVSSISAAYVKLGELLMEFLEEKFALPLRSQSREELEPLLVEEKGLSKELWDRFNRVFDQIDRVRFSGDQNIADDTALLKWTEEAESLVRELQEITLR